MKIYIRNCAGAILPIAVESNITVKQLKETLNMKGINLLLFMSMNLEDHKTLAEYGIKSDSVLNEVSPIQIFIKTLNEKIITLMINPYETVESLKNKICNKESTMKDKNYMLTFNIRYLRNDISLNEYGIKEYSTLTLVARYNTK